MVLRYYINTVSRLGTGIAKVIFATGLLLISLGALILAFPEIFAILVAALLLALGIACLITAGKIFWQNRTFRKHQPDDSDSYRENVRIHLERDFE